ncbi:hypothetical protein G5I_11647 [Acromyrmex echinatior]|uniref:Uncharacterized protein n=1 Tax=Acromyrmex echinatior TaxID=103372 RepID=F4X059_ACREC|nr:hypothetical protein G5I_11647 [Acromyrmex echinatior]
MGSKGLETSVPDDTFRGMHHMPAPRGNLGPPFLERFLQSDGMSGPEEPRKQRPGPACNNSGMSASSASAALGLGVELAIQGGVNHLHGVSHHQRWERGEEEDGLFLSLPLSS